MENFDEEIKDEFRIILDGLSEVELFFVVQEVFKKRKEVEHSEKLELMLEHSIKLTKNFGVKQPTEKRPGNFMKWVEFWKKWQSELIISEMETMIECLYNKQPFDELLPKYKWNEKPPIINTCPKGHQC